MALGPTSELVGFHLIHVTPPTLGHRECPGRMLRIRPRVAVRAIVVAVLGCLGRGPGALGGRCSYGLGIGSIHCDTLSERRSVCHGIVRPACEGSGGRSRRPFERLAPPRHTKTLLYVPSERRAERSDTDLSKALLTGDCHSAPCRSGLRQGRSTAGFAFCMWA